METGTGAADAAPVLMVPCERRESNPDPFRDRILSPARLPVPPRSRCGNIKARVGPGPLACRRALRIPGPFDTPARARIGATDLRRASQLSIGGMDTWLTPKVRSG